MSEMHLSSKLAQAEYVKARENGYGFAAHGRVWHYLYPIDLVEPITRARLPANATHAIYTVQMDYAEKDIERCVVTPTSDPVNWIAASRAIAARERFGGASSW